MSLPILVAQDLWQEFDNAWKERMASEEPVDDLVIALHVAGDKKRISRCTSMAKEHAELLEAGSRPADAARVLGALLIAGGNPSEIAEGLFRCSEAAWKDEDWWSAFTELSGFQQGAPDLRKPWKSFDKLRSFTVGRLVNHPGGWGVGEILDVRAADGEVDVKFWNGRRDTFPMNAAMDIFVPLSESELIARHFRDPENLRKSAKKEPLDVMRAIAETNHGSMTTTTLRLAMMSIGIEGSAWSAWWRKARKLAENSEWFEVSGSPAKSIVRLLLVAKDPSETLRRQLELAEGVHEVLTRVRELFIGQKVDDKIKAVGLEVLATAADNEHEPIIDRIGAWLLLREQHGETPEALREALAVAKDSEAPTDPSVPPELWRIFGQLPSARDQERCVEVLMELYEDSWVDEAARHLPHASAGMVRPLVDVLIKAKRTADLKTHYAAMLARPMRAPSLLVSLARVFEVTDPGGDLPTPAQRAQALLSLARHLFDQRRGNAQLTRVHQRLVDLLTSGDTPVLRRLLKDIDDGALRGMMLHQRGIDDAIDHMLTDIALEKDRDFFAQDEIPFWKRETIWTTKAGLERRSSELRELREVKIPENQDAIGRAASYGDLSENAEWEAAMEEMRNLTSRAMEMEEELRLADLIDNATLPEDKICPGMCVVYRESETGTENQVTILGPWDDMLGEDVVSYRAPLAAGLLGLEAGDEAVLELPGGDLAVKVVSLHQTEHVV